MIIKILNIYKTKCLYDRKKKILSEQLSSGKSCVIKATYYVVSGLSLCSCHGIRDYCISQAVSLESVVSLLRDVGRGEV